MAALKKKKLHVRVLFVLIFFSNQALSLERVWTNVIGDNLWSEPLNWIPIGVPQATDSVLTTYVDRLTIPANYNASIKYILLLGDLTIETGAELSINDGHFNCNGMLINQGTISINNSPTYGLRQSSFQLNSQPITNEGSIFINNSALAGLWIRDDQTFTNEEGGFVEITNSGEASIELLGTFSNRGTLRAQGSITETALLMQDEESSFVNLRCARTIFRDKINMNNGDFNNFGFLRQNYNSTNDFLFTSAINYGLIEDIQASFAEADIINFGIWIKSVDDQILEGEPTSIFIHNSPLGSSISDVYLENDLITLAGSYDYDNNIWVPNAAAVGESNFFVEVSQDNGACKDTVKFSLTSGVEGVNYWKGGTGSWQFGINWNYGTVPSALDKVAIYQSTDDVSIPISYSAFAKDLLIKGKVRIAPLSTLTIDEPIEERSIELYEGTLINNGKILLKKTAKGIYLEGSYFENNGDITCISSGTCIELMSIQNDKSEFLNNFNGTVSADSASLLTVSNSVVKNYGLLDSKINDFHTSMSGDSLYNFGTINIKGESVTKGKGVSLDFVNFPSGVISISKLEEGIVSSGFNSGNITLDTCSVGFRVSGGNFINEDGGFLEISHCTEGMNIGVRDFYNNPGGHVKINRSGEGILIPSSAILFNKGLIEIDSSLTHGIECFGELYNELSAQIIIDRGFGIGLFLEFIAAHIYCRDQSSLKIYGHDEGEFLIEKGYLFLEDNATIHIKSN